jgi:cyclopropane fatty-acyl-phospholipid synthase-like methyltransferase
MTELHLYSEDFFEYIERGAIASAKEFVRLLVPLLRPASVLDVGCGRGAWLREWKAAGIQRVRGVDGPYVRLDQLHIARDEFSPVNLSASFDLGEKFDLVTSFEVAEHLDPSCCERFVSTLAAHADIVAFSAATPGQGGENHINERPLAFWQALFSALGYEAYDVLRSALKDNRNVEPWYRFNSILYVKREVIHSLPAEVQRTRIAPRRVQEVGDIGWRLRKSILRPLPVSAVTALSRLNYHRLNRGHRKKLSKNPR